MAERTLVTHPLRWVALIVVLVTALMVGSGVLSSTSKTQEQRITAIESSLKCPSCQDLSVAQSTSPSSLAIRHQISNEVRAGRSDAEIIASLQARYGATVELTPTGGLSVVLWVVPIALVVAAVLALILWRRRHREEAR
jgi:cytochrome c-type biogenesis protein CcmH/NrfF